MRFSLHTERALSSYCCTLCYAAVFLQYIDLAISYCIVPYCSVRGGECQCGHQTKRFSVRRGLLSQSGCCSFVAVVVLFRHSWRESRCSSIFVLSRMYPICDKHMTVALFFFVKQEYVPPVYICMCSFFSSS